MFEYPDSCRKLFDRVLEKLVSSKHFTVANAARELLIIARSSHRTYTQKLAERKKEELKNKPSQQLENVNDEILALKPKKDLLEDTLAELKKDSNDTAFETYKQSKLELLFKSIALKRVAIEKQVELDACLKEKRLIE